MSGTKHYVVRKAPLKLPPHGASCPATSQSVQQILDRDARHIHDLLSRAAGGARSIQQSLVAQLAASDELIASECRQLYGQEAAQRTYWTEATARSAANRLEGNGRLVPARTAGENHQHSYAIEEAFRILLALYLERNFHIRAPRATKEVLAFFERQGVPSELDPILSIALGRVERYLSTRIRSVLLSWIYGTLLPVGTVALVRILGPEEPELPIHGAEEQKAWIFDQLRLYNNDVLCVVSKYAEPVLLDKPLSQEALHKRAFRVAVFGAGTDRYVAVVGIPRQIPGVEVATQLVHADLVPLIHDLLWATTDGLKVLRSNLLADYGLRWGQTGPGIALPPTGQDILLWLAAKLICVLACPEAPHKANCIIFSSAQGAQGSQPVYTAVASSGQDQELGHHLLHRVTHGQLLSGYAAPIGTTLAVHRTLEDWQSLLVSNHQIEQKEVQEPVLSCLAVPIPSPIEGASPVLYVSRPVLAEEEMFELLVRKIQVLAPFVGELMLRGESAVYSVAAATRTLKERLIGPEQVEEAFTAAVEGLLQSEHVAKGRHDGDERLPVVLLKPQVEELEFKTEIELWFTKQLTYLIPGTFLSHSTAQCPNLMAVDRYLYGDLGPATGAAALLIPDWFTKPELDRLRATLPTRINSMPLGVLGDGRPVVRLDVWIIDVRKSRLRQEGARAVVQTVLADCRRTAAICDHLMTGFRKAYLEGNWSGALSEVCRGIDRQPGNAYLLRRASEINLWQGKFARATRDAEAALKYDRASISATCLLGDTLVGQGRLLEALDQYATARAAAPASPQPNFALGQALLTVARFLRQWLYDQSIKLIETGSAAAPLLDEEHAVCVEKIANFFNVSRATSRQQLQISTIIQLCEFLAKRASHALSDARPWPTTRPLPIDTAMRGSEWSAWLFALGRAARISEDPDDSVEKLQAAIKSWPGKDHLLLQELVLAYMRKDHGLPLRLLRELSADQALVEIVRITQ